MNNLGIGTALAAALTFSVQAGVVPAVSVSVHVASAPAAMGPSFGNWSNNAAYALRNDLTNYGGDITQTPLAYVRAADSMHITDMVATSSFFLWRGLAYPGGAFAQERGNGLMFGVAAVATGGAQLALNQMRFDIYLEGTPEADGYHFGVGFLNGNYNSGIFGVRVGADGLLNTSDDIVLTSGDGSLFVDAIYCAGFTEIGYSINTPTQLLTIEQHAGFRAWCDWTVYHPLGTIVGTDSVNVVPAPGALGLLCLAMLARCRRR